MPSPTLAEAALEPIETRAYCIRCRAVFVLPQRSEVPIEQWAEAYRAKCPNCRRAESVI